MINTALLQGNFTIFFIYLFLYKINQFFYKAISYRKTQNPKVSLLNTSKYTKYGLNIEFGVKSIHI